MEASFIITFFIGWLVESVSSHGRLLEPPSRASMWRFNYGTPANYNDNQLYCGGFFTQWDTNKGKCGVCGDPWNGPREHETGGKYATGKIVRKYDEGQIIEIVVQVTASHKGYFEFRVCPRKNQNIAATQDCLDKYVLKQRNGAERVHESGSPRNYSIEMELPPGLYCEQCLLQWKWNTGNSYGCFGNNCCVGCGRQEQFYGCADISIQADRKHRTTPTAIVKANGKINNGSPSNIEYCMMRLLICFIVLYSFVL